MFNKSSKEVKDLFEAMKAFIVSLGDDIQIKELKFYYAFKKIKNFVTVEIHPQNNTIVLYLSLDPNKIKLEKGFTRDVTNIGHWGTGDLEVTLKSYNDIERCKTLILKSYEQN